MCVTVWRTARLSLLGRAEDSTTSVADRSVGTGGAAGLVSLRLWGVNFPAEALRRGRLCL